MRWLILLTLAGFALAGSAAADPQTDALCRPIQGEWESVARGNDLAAMDREIAKIPPLCADLKVQARRRLDAVRASLRPQVARAPTQIRLARMPAAPAASSNPPRAVELAS